MKIHIDSNSGFTKFLAVALIFAMLLTSIPFYAIALDDNNSILSEETYTEEEPIWEDDIPAQIETSPSDVYYETNDPAMPEDTTWTDDLSDQSEPSISDTNDENISSELSEDIYTEDTILVDDSPVQIEIPPSLTYDDSIFSVDSDYEYIPRAERTVDYIKPNDGKSKETIIEKIAFPDVPESWKKDYVSSAKQLEMYLSFVHETLYESETDIMLRSYLSKGYSLKQVMSAYGVSRALEINMDSLLTKKTTDSANNKNTDSYKLPDNLSKIDKRNYELLAEDLGVRADTLADYAAKNSRTFSDVEKLTYIAISYIYELSTLEPAKKITSDSGGSKGVSIDPSNDINIGAPYSYDYNTAENVNLNTGGLRYENVDYVLPGVNGLDLVIGRRYNSDNSNLFLNTYWLSNGGILGGSYADYYSYPQDVFGLGYGWSYMFSTIEVRDVTSILHLSDGRSFNFSTTASSPALQKHDLSDLDLRIASNAYNNGQISSYWTLTYKDGKREYFSANGKLIGIKDKYGNTIKFVNGTSNGYPSMTITDTLNRVTTISCTSVTSSHAVITVTLPNSLFFQYKILLNYETFPKGNGGYHYNYDYSAIAEYTDTTGATTYYGHTLRTGAFNYLSDETANNYFMSLRTVTYPTGVISEFYYESVRKIFGYAISYGAYENTIIPYLQTEYRINSREDKIGTNIYIQPPCTKVQGMKGRLKVVIQAKAS